MWEGGGGGAKYFLFRAEMPTKLSESYRFRFPDENHQICVQLLQDCVVKFIHLKVTVTVSGKMIPEIK